uniref:ORF2 n=1 Tax=TTV-like mini virus TaxID=93678 RepID=A0A4Y5SRM9_9VIRU|nr:ORF2 [TTV-like mini virus]
MSDYWRKITLGPRAQQTNWMNSLVTGHDLYCQCDDPLKHIILTIVEREPTLKFNKEESLKIQKCLTTGDEGPTDTVDTFGGDELEKLFDQDVFGEEDAGTG